MYYDELGNKNNETIIFLHGSNIVYTFVRQYCLKDDYHLIIPHINGFGREVDKIYHLEETLSDLINLIKSFNKKVYLVGFSLGAQLGFVLLSRCPELFKKVILVSPWLIKKSEELAENLDENLFLLLRMQNKTITKLICLLNKIKGAYKRHMLEYVPMISEETIKNMVNETVFFENYPEYKNCSVPVLGICGANEDEEMKESVKALAEQNSLGTYEIWDDYGHDIPQQKKSPLLEKIKEYFKND